jgi:hypothetical protein
MLSATGSNFTTINTTALTLFDTNACTLPERENRAPSPSGALVLHSKTDTALTAYSTKDAILAGNPSGCPSICVWDFPDDDDDLHGQANHAVCTKVDSEVPVRGCYHHHETADVACHEKQQASSPGADVPKGGDSDDRKSSCLMVLHTQQQQQALTASPDGSADLAQLHLLLTELQLCLAVLENATFACKENEQLLVNMKVCAHASYDLS